MQGLKLKVIVFSVFLGLLSGLSHAEVYRWTDDKGKVHFGDRPTTDNASEVKIKEPKVATPTKNDSDRKQDAARFLRSRELDRIEKAQQKQKSQQQAAKRARKCKTAKLELRKLREARLLYTKDKSGKKHYITDAERASEKKKTADIVDYWCN